MGYGEKMAFYDGKKTPQVINMDLVYKKLVKPALNANKIKYVRGDDINKSSIIDNTMYPLLLTSDLVIADISTLNANAMYELGIRHALKPYSTIIICESEQEIFPFDISHIGAFKYEYKKIKTNNEYKNNLDKKIKETLLNMSKQNNREKCDSPVYNSFYAENLSIDTSDIKKREIWSNTAEKVDKVAKKISDAQKVLDNKKINNKKRKRAINKFLKLSKKYPEEPYFTQKLAYLYRMKDYDLKKAEKEILKLKPFTSLDTETTGIFGGIEKRLYKKSKSTVYLDNALKVYKRGYVLKNDYYNGENYINCLCLKYIDYMKQKNCYQRLTKKEKNWYKVEIYTENKRILGIAKRIFDVTHDFWAAATLSNCYLLDNDYVKFNNLKQFFYGNCKNEEEKKSFDKTVKLRKKFMKKSAQKDTTN